jgi:hypothetical protein
MNSIFTLLVYFYKEEAGTAWCDLLW